MRPKNKMNGIVKLELSIRFIKAKKNTVNRTHGKNRRNIYDKDTMKAKLYKI